jgi:hypothetical protein
MFLRERKNETFERERKFQRGEINCLRKMEKQRRSIRRTGGERWKREAEQEKKKKKGGGRYVEAREEEKEEENERKRKGRHKKTETLLIINFFQNFLWGGHSCPAPAYIRYSLSLYIYIYYTS